MAIYHAQAAEAVCDWSLSRYPLHIRNMLPQLQREARDVPIWVKFGQLTSGHEDTLASGNLIIFNSSQWNILPF
jgi:hypothetical protein